MRPLETWRKNNWRSDLRKYTKAFESKFKSKDRLVTEAGKVYAITYRTLENFPTDKHHVTPIFLSFGRFKDDEGRIYVRGLNLLFLRTDQCIEVLENSYNHVKEKADSRAVNSIKVHEKFISVFPYAFKNFEEKRILSVSEVSSEDWGMIPLLHKYIWGTFNPVALNESFQEENKIEKTIKKKKPRGLNSEKKEDVIEEELLESDYLNEEGLVDLD